MTDLIQLHEAIDARVQSIREQHPGWLCGKGCDSCCRRLADIPRLTLDEWRFLRQGLRALSPGQLDDVRMKAVALADQEGKTFVCPMLDQATGSCLVYFHRPVACRTYGFYVQRGLGLYCEDIRSDADAGMLDDVVWGNHDGIDALLLADPVKLSLPEWFDSLQPGEEPASG